MSSAVDIGTLQGTIAFKNAYSAEFDKFDKEIKEKLIKGVRHFSEQTRIETIAIQHAYQRVAASLDPVAANTQKYQRAQIAINAALKSGIITQDQYNKSLFQAKEKYLSTSSSTLTWREEIQRLTNTIPGLSGRIGDLISKFDQVKDGLLGTSQATAAAGTSAKSAAVSFSSLYAVAAPLAAILGTVAIAAGGVYLGLKSFSFLKEVVTEGIKTQLIIERLNNALQATGSYSTLTSAQLVTLAESYELLSGRTKEEIVSAEIILSRFDSLNKQSYPEALRLTLAYAKAMGVTADQAAHKLGPAYEGSARSLLSLREAGIVLTNSQRKMLQEMVESGKVAEYQAILMGLLKEKVGDLSTEYDKNLSRQVARSKIVMEDFGEAIANQVIPALEDVFDEIITSLGGWDNLKKKVNEVGGAIGNFIRTYIYGLAIAFHDLMAEIDIFIADYGNILRVLSQPIRVAIPSFQIPSQKEARKSAVEHAEAIIRLTGAFNEHRTALEGNTEVYGSNGSALDDIIAKNQELARLTDELTDIYADQTLELERIYALRMLATKGPFTKEERLAEEKKINEAHKERIVFLKQEEKFGTAIAESLAKQRKELENLESKAKIELILATKLEPIIINTDKLKDQLSKILDDDWGRSMKLLDDIITVEDKNRQEFEKTFQAYDDLVSQTAANWLESFRTMSDIAEEEISYVKEAVAQGLMEVSQGERAIAVIREQQYGQYLDQWTGFLSYLGDAFGGFFQQIAQLAQSVQGVNSTAQSLGGWSSAMGAFGGTVAAFVELYKFADAMITKHKGEKYGTRASFDMTGGLEGLSYFDQAGNELIRAIRSTLESFEDALRISAEDLDQIEIRVRNNGEAVQAWVKGQWIGTFTDVQTAIREALLVAISDPSAGLSGLSPLMLEGLGSWTSPDMEGLLDYLKILRQISDLSLSPQAVQLQQMMLEFDRMREALNKLDQSTQAVIDAQRDLTRAQIDAINQTKNALLGIDTSAAQAIRSLAGLDKGMTDVSDSFARGIQVSIDAAQKQLDKLNRNVVAPNRDNGGRGNSGDGSIIAKTLSGTTEEIESEKRRLEQAIKEWQDQLAEVPRALSEQEIDFGILSALEDDMRKTGKYAAEIAELERYRVTKKYEELRLELIAIGAWERWADIWQELYDQAKKDAGKIPSAGRGSGAGSSDKDSVRDFIKDKKFEISLVGLTDYQKSLKELDKQYDDLIRQAGNDKKLKGELLALKEKEIALLEKEKKLRTVEKFEDFVNPSNQFDKVRKTAADLIKEIKDSPFGDERKARMIGRVMDALDKQLTDLAKQAALGLFSSMLSDMEKFGATEEQMRAAREMAAILEHEMKLANYALTIAELEAEGRLSQEQIDTFHDMYDFLAGIDPRDFIPKTGNEPANDNFSSYTSGNAFEEFEDLLSRVQDKLAEWNRIPLSESLSKAHELTDSFSELMEDVNKLIPFGWNYTAIAQQTFQKLIRNFVNDTLTEFEESGNELEDTLRGIGERFTDINSAFIHLGATQEDLLRAEQARLNAVTQALSSYLDPIRERRLARLVGERSILTGEQQYYNAQAQFRDMLNQIESGDLTNLGNVVNLADQYEDLLRSFTGGEGLRFGLKEIDDALASIEQLVPGFAQEMAEIGTSDNPMHVEQQNMINAIEQNREAVNAGNTLMLGELRTGVSEMREQTRRLDNIEVALSQPLQVRNVA